MSPLPFAEDCNRLAGGEGRATVRVPDRRALRRIAPSRGLGRAVDEPPTGRAGRLRIQHVDRPGHGADRGRRRKQDQRRGRRCVGQSKQADETAVAVSVAMAQPHQHFRPGARRSRLGSRGKPTFEMVHEARLVRPVEIGGTGLAERIQPALHGSARSTTSALGRLTGEPVAEVVRVRGRR